MNVGGDLRRQRTGAKGQQGKDGGGSGHEGNQNRGVGLWQREIDQRRWKSPQKPGARGDFIANVDVQCGAKNRTPG